MLKAEIPPERGTCVNKCPHLIDQVMQKYVYERSWPANSLWGLYMRKGVHLSKRSAFYLKGLQYQCGPLRCFVTPLDLTQLEVTLLLELILS